MLAGPEVARLVNEFEESITDDKLAIKHHEQAAHYQTAFVRDVNSLVSTFNGLGNPFAESSDELISLGTKDIITEEVVQSVLRAKQLGITQYGSFVANRIARIRWLLLIPLRETI